MHHNRSMSECLNGARIIESKTEDNQVLRVRDDYREHLTKLFSCASDHRGLPMRQRNLPSSFFHPPREANGVTTGIAHKVSVAHPRNTSFDLQGLNSWRVNNDQQAQQQQLHHQQQQQQENQRQQQQAQQNQQQLPNLAPPVHVKQECVPLGGANSESCLLDLDLEADMARMRQNRKDCDRLRSSMFNSTPNAEPSSAPVVVNGQNDYRSPNNSTNQLTYLSSGSASGSGSILDSESSPTLFNNNNTNNNLLKPQLPYQHLRQTSVDSGLGLYTQHSANTNGFAKKWRTTHHGHTHSVNIVPDYNFNARTLNPQSTSSIDKSSTSLHNSRSSIAGSGTIAQSDEIVHPSHIEDMDPDNLTPTLPDLLPYLCLDDLMSTINE